jgi:hypothetical protein
LAGENDEEKDNLDDNRTEIIRWKRLERNEVDVEYILAEE